MKPNVSAIKKLAQGERGFWLAAAALGGALSVGKGFRAANDWATTGLQLDYSEGFIKRGLVGEALTLLHLPVGRHVFDQTFAFIVAFAFALALLRLAWVTLRRDPWFVIPIAVFASSAAPGYLAHLVGYPDILLATIALVLVQVRAGWWRVGLLALGAVTAILVHEEFLLLFLPVVLLPITLAAVRGREAPGRLILALAPALIVAGVATGTVVALSFAPPLSPERMARLFHRLSARADFPLRQDEFDVLVRSAADNVRVTLQYPFWNDNLAGLLMFAPSTAFLLWSAWGRLGAMASGWRLSLARAATLGAALAPLAMHLIGWDHFRWDAWMLFDAFVALAIVGSEAGPAPPSPLGERTRWAVLLLVLLNVGTGGGLMDEAQPHLFPYTEGWTGWTEGHSPEDVTVSGNTED